MSSLFRHKVMAPVVDQVPVVDYIVIKKGVILGFPFKVGHVNTYNLVISVLLTLCHRNIE